ncbi:coproporphyrinogen III oxidase [Nodosilinea sp. LEGE 06152]|uniref:radical SAM family heme chaperone HemW n=1 Tax=Nodosilinea sp. LEGE 06152 TaxID=2777966 RepID=UPI001880220A|nr:radical SAM family heme chaperone HemW [Nodosilinea sp. LEGE 06152]MBE9160688.1 coproporphyrinogen III oxidase [Nodosilinea sp. LEGE 06152]
MTNHSPTILSPAAAYLHIPFCRRRCFYCDFPISVLGNQRRGETSGTVESYVKLLCEEIGATPRLNEQPLQTVFFGGGTPSLLSIPQLEQILAQLDRRFGIAPAAEISMEMDPGTFVLLHLQGYLTAGVNRISLGVQALDDATLESCGRYHRTADVYRAVDWLHQVAMPNWSLDLISGLPHQTLADWETGLAKAIALHPHHLSIYDLTVEPQTVFAQRYQPGDTPLPTDEQTAAMYRLAQAFLTAQGYDHYEVSNYAQPGHQCQHNLTYWHNQPYYGFGLGAASYTQHQRVSRPRTLTTYGEWVKDFKAAGGIHTEPPTPALEQLLDRLMLGLRLKAGISGDELRSHCSPKTWAVLYQTLTPHIQSGLVVAEGDTWDDLRCLRLSDPEGFLFSNVVLSDCFRALEDWQER